MTTSDRPDVAPDGTATLVFDTTHHALWAEDIARELRLGAEVIPAPADAQAKCDLALEVLASDLDALIRALIRHEVPHRVHRPAHNDGPDRSDDA